MKQTAVCFEGARCFVLPDLLQEFDQFLGSQGRGGIRDQGGIVLPAAGALKSTERHTVILFDDG